jgi:hypothetical protein
MGEVVRGKYEVKGQKESKVIRSTKQGQGQCGLLCFGGGTGPGVER